MDETSKVTIRDVAKLAGVSVSSVSRYLNDENSIRPMAAYKIREAINALQYVPDASARNLRSKKSNIVGIVLPHTRFFWGNICNTVTNILSDKGYTCYVCITDNDGIKERNYIDELVNMHAAGIIIVPCGQNTRYLQSVSDHYKKMLLFDSQEIECETVLPLKYQECTEHLTNYMLEKYPDE